MTPSSLTRHRTLVQILAFTVITYGLIIIAGSLIKQQHIHTAGRDIGDLFVAVPLIIGLTFIYLGSLLARRKHNAWIATLALFIFVLGLNLSQAIHPRPGFDFTSADALRGILVPSLITVGLLVARESFRVQSDMRSIAQALRFSFIIILVALLYGVGGFMLLDTRDFHKEIGPSSALHYTVDQFGLTTDSPSPQTHRAKLFLDSLSGISVATGVYVIISLFQPLRTRFSDQSVARAHAESLLEHFPSDIDDFFKLWPHDKLYFFDKSSRAGLAYHVSRGQALVVGDPFGDPKRFAILLSAFLELCFVNDWQPAFIHTTDKYQKLYEQFDFRQQKIGEEAVLDLESFQTEVGSKYFRQIRNRFTKLGYQVELLQPPHATSVLRELHKLSSEWLQRPGREERGFMMGYFSSDYMQRGPVAVALDAERKIQGFINLVPTFQAKTANYDLLRFGSQAPGNCNDFLLLGLIELLRADGIVKLNLGLTPLAGLDDEAGEDATFVHNTLRFLYANGDRFYSFSGLRRFKEKYRPNWEDRFIVYRGGPASFTRTLAALNRVMKVK